MTELMSRRQIDELIGYSDPGSTFKWLARNSIEPVSTVVVNGKVENRYAADQVHEAHARTPTATGKGGFNRPSRRITARPVREGLRLQAEVVENPAERAHQAWVAFKPGSHVARYECILHATGETCDALGRWQETADEAIAAWRKHLRLSAQTEVRILQR